MKKALSYYKRLYQRFGIKAIEFLLKSKFKIDKTSEIKIRKIRYPVTLSNFKYDVTTLFQVFFAEEYNVRFKTPPGIVIDCGANIGLSAVYFANQFPEAKIIAIEPDENNFKFLEENTIPYPNVICLQKAVWPYSQKLEIVDPGKGNWGLQTKEPGNGAGKIDTITIDEIMQQFQLDSIDFLKIDIEGAEKELFSSNYENWLAKTNVMAIELHDFFDPSISPVFFKAIEPYGFRQYRLGENLILEKPNW